MRSWVCVSILVAVIAAERPARADNEVRLAVDGAVSRARRKVAIGPMIGVGAAYSTGGTELDVPISFGIGFDLFKVPVIPSTDDIKAVITQTVEKRVGQRIEDMIARGEPPPSAAETASMAEEILQQLKDEYLGKRPRDRKLEKPQLAIALEEVRLPRAGAWMTRLTIGVGISKFTIGPSITGSLGDVRGAYLGGELAIHLTPRSGPRSPVIDVLLRADWGLSGGAREHDLFTFGVRAMLDLI